MRRSVAWLLPLLLGSAAYGQEDVRWGDSVPKALEQAARSQKPVLALFWAEW